MKKKIIKNIYKEENLIKKMTNLRNYENYIKLLKFHFIKIMDVWYNLYSSCKLIIDENTF